MPAKLSSPSERVLSTCVDRGERSRPSRRWWSERGGTAKKLNWNWNASMAFSVQRHHTAALRHSVPARAPRRARGCVHNPPVMDSIDTQDTGPANRTSRRRAGRFRLMFTRVRMGPGCPSLWPVRPASARDAVSFISEGLHELHALVTLASVAGSRPRSLRRRFSLPRPPVRDRR